jgi:hypothetical protein
MIQYVQKYIYIYIYIYISKLIEHSYYQKQSNNHLQNLNSPTTEKKTEKWIRSEP